MCDKPVAVNSPKKSNAAPAYLPREPFFANKFLRLLADSEVANSIGAQTCWLLTVIVLTEDKTRYVKPVTFYNRPLARDCGFGESVDKLDRIRAKAIDAGWLSYTPGTYGVPGSYFVTIPKEHQRVDTGTVQPATIRTHADSARGDSIRTSAEDRGEDRGEDSADLSSLPSPIPNTPLTPREARGEEIETLASKQNTRKSNPDFERFFAAYPRKVDRRDALRAWRELSPDAPLIETILAAVVVYAKSRQGQEEQYTLKPSNWLRKEKWTDSIAINVRPEKTPEQRAAETRAIREQADRDAQACDPEAWRRLRAERGRMPATA